MSSDNAHLLHMTWINGNPFRKGARFIVVCYYLGFTVALFLYIGTYLWLMVFSEDFRAHHNNFEWLMGSVLLFFWPLGILLLLLFIGFFIYFSLSRIF